MSRPADRRRVVAAVAVLTAGLGGAASLFMAPSGPARDTAAETRALGAQVEAQLRESAAGLHARVATLAELPRLAAAVSTDAATVKDLTSDELSLRPKPGETLTIAQLPTKPGAAKPVLLLVLPADAPAAPLEPGRGLAIEAGRLVLREAVTIVPRDRADELRGLLAATWPADLTAVADRLRAAGAHAELVVGGARAPLGAPALARAETAEASLDTGSSSEARFGEARLVVSWPKAPARSPALPAAIAAVALAAAAFLLLSRKREPPIPAGSVIDLPALAPARDGASETRPPLGPPAPLHSAPTALASGPAPKGGAGQFGRYSIVRPLGAGGMAEVFLAQVRGEAGFEKTVALKIMKPEVALYPGAVEHLLDEARLAARLDHPNIVQVIDLGRSADAYFIAMEYVDGYDLERLIELSRAFHEQVPLDVAIAIVCHACAGLHAAHTARSPEGVPLDIVHRDVKSANVLCARNGAIKVADFGIATATPAARVSRTEIGQVKGTPGYMAPEHRLGQPVDLRADVYGVGAIAYEVLTGAPVNLDAALLSVQGKVGWPHLPPPSAVRAGLPGEIDAIVAKALSYDRDDRFADCAALGDAFAAVPIGAPPANARTIARWVNALLERAGLPTSGARPSAAPSSAAGRG